MHYKCSRVIAFSIILHPSLVLSLYIFLTNLKIMRGVNYAFCVCAGTTFFLHLEQYKEILFYINIKFKSLRRNNTELDSL